MSYNEYLKFDGMLLPMPTSYDIDLTDIEADSSGETEAGTAQRDVVRTGVISISVSFAVSPTWLKKLTIFSKQNKITVSYFDTAELELKQTEMFITGFKVKLYRDTIYKGLWNVSFTLNEY